MATKVYRAVSTWIVYWRYVTCSLSTSPRGRFCMPCVTRQHRYYRWYRHIFQSLIKQVAAVLTTKSHIAGGTCQITSARAGNSLCFAMGRKNPPPTNFHSSFSEGPGLHLPQTASRLVQSFLTAHVANRHTETMLRLYSVAVGPTSASAAMWQDWAQLWIHFIMGADCLL